LIYGLHIHGFYFLLKIINNKAFFSPNIDKNFRLAYTQLCTLHRGSGQKSSYQSIDLLSCAKPNQSGKGEDRMYRNKGLLRLKKESQLTKKTAKTR